MAGAAAPYRCAHAHRQAVCRVPGTVSQLLLGDLYDHLEDQCVPLLSHARKGGGALVGWMGTLRCTLNAGVLHQWQMLSVLCGGSRWASTFAINGWI